MPHNGYYFDENPKKISIYGIFL